MIWIQFKGELLNLSKATKIEKDSDKHSRTIWLYYGQADTDWAHEIDFDNSQNKEAAFKKIVGLLSSNSAGVHQVP